VIFDFLDRSALRNIGRRPQAIPKNGYEDVALLENLAIDNPLSAIPHVWKGVSFPSDRLQDHPVGFRMYRIPFVDDLPSNSALRLNVTGRGDEYVVDCCFVGIDRNWELRLEQIAMENARLGQCWLQPFRHFRLNNRPVRQQNDEEHLARWPDTDLAPGPTKNTVFSVFRPKDES
jgi:hypothetical protein